MSGQLTIAMGAQKMVAAAIWETLPPERHNQLPAWVAFTAELTSPPPAPAAA